MPGETGMTQSGGSPTAREIVYVENIGLGILPYLLFRAWRGDRIYFLSVGKWAGKVLSDHRYMKNGRFSRFDLTGYYREPHYRNNRLVVEAIKAQYPEWSRDNQTLSAIRTLINSPDLDLAYQKILALELYQLYRTASILSLLARDERGARLTFIPGRGFRPPISTGILESVLNAKGASIHLSRLEVIGRILRGLDTLKWAGILAGYPLWILLRNGITGPAPNTVHEFQVGIRTYSTDWGFRNKYRTVDFLLDGSRLNAANCVFCIDDTLPGYYRDQFRARNYTTIDMKQILRHADPGFLRHTVGGKIIPVWADLLLHALTQPPVILMKTLEFLDTYLRWEYFYRKYRIRHFVVYNDYLPAETVRNIVLREHGTESWFYEHSSNYSFVTFPPDSGYLPHLTEAYLNYDHMVTWGEFLIRFNETMPNRNRRYENLGCLWSEHIMSVQRTGLPNRFLHDISARFPALQAGTMKLVGIFDTTADVSTPLQFEDIARFYEDALRLLEDLPGILLVFKNKWRLDTLLEHEPRVAPIFARIKENPRCFLIADQDYDSSDVIAACDLVLSACFTAPTVEALGARRKAMFHDATNKFPDGYYSKFPHLVSRDYENLKECVDFWLNKTTPAEFDQYLERYIRNEVEAGLDGLAITRFRRLLAGRDPEFRTPGSASRPE
jgi:polysaccharide biosynthesis PFTS motif protein